MQTQSKAAFAFVLLAASPVLVKALFGVSSASRLKPQMVATTLVKMEDEWKSQSELFAECNLTSAGSGKPPSACSGAYTAFQQSCGTVVNAVQRASNGDRELVSDYMGDVCGQAALDGWRRERCQSLASAITGAMAADNYQNRENLDVAGLCKKYWSSFAAIDVALAKKRAAEAEVRRASRATEAKRMSEKRAAEEKKAAEQLAEQEKRRTAEEAAHKLVEDAQRKAEEEQIAAKQALAKRKTQDAQHRLEAAKADAEVARLKKEAAAVKATVPKATKIPETRASNDQDNTTKELVTPI